MSSLERTALEGSGVAGNSEGKVLRVLSIRLLFPPLLKRGGVRVCVHVV